MKIFHITTAEEWSLAQQSGSYSHPSLASDGFIHLSSGDQVAATIDRYYENTAGLILLEVDPERVRPGALVWEASTGGEDFPHLYGELNLDAVTHVHVWEGTNPDIGNANITSPDITNPDDRASQ